jgi:hypothetical protein
MVGCVVDVEPQCTQTILMCARRKTGVARWLTVRMVLMWSWLEEIPATWPSKNHIIDIIEIIKVLQTLIQFTQPTPVTTILLKNLRVTQSTEKSTPLTEPEGYKWSCCWPITCAKRIQCTSSNHIL